MLAGEIARGAGALARRCAIREVVQYKWIIVALIVGAAIGIPLGMVHMTAVPQRTALSHAFGALSAAMIGIAEYYVGIPHVTRFGMAEIGLEVIIGSLTFTGSLIAAAKLQEVKFIAAAARSPIRARISLAFRYWPRRWFFSSRWS